MDSFEQAEYYEEKREEKFRREVIENQEEQIYLLQEILKAVKQPYTVTGGSIRQVA